MSFKVVYLTGAPAAGKSTLIRTLAQKHNHVEVFEYGARMASWLSSKPKLPKQTHQHELRGGTEGRVADSDIEMVDDQMRAWIQSRRNHANLIIDSHQVTIENYGFRVAPFSAEQLHTFGIDEFWLLVLDSTSTLARIDADPKGRPLPSEFQANLHTSLQANVAVSYAVQLGRPIYVMDGNLDQASLIKFAEARLN